MDGTFDSSGNALEVHIARPERLRSRGTPALILCHGFPDAAVGAAGAARSYPPLAQRVAEDLGWIAVAFAYRGCGSSEGSFSVKGWLDDVQAAVAHVRATNDVSATWLAGFGTGGSLAICAAAADPSIAGVAAFAAPADFSDWAADPSQLLNHARAIGAVARDDFPADFDAWAAELVEVSAADAAAELSLRHMLVVHGADDPLVPNFDARILADAHGTAELRIVSGAEHALRYDPRAIAILLGWLRRER